MDRLEQAIQRAEEARRILDSPMFSQAFEDTRQALFESIAKLDSVKEPQAAELHGMVRCLAKVRRCLETHIETGRLANKELEGRKRLFDFRRA